MLCQRKPPSWHLARLRPGLEGEGKTAFENSGISYLELAGAMEDEREDAKKQENPGGREISKMS